MDRRVVMAMKVDDAGGDDEAAGIEHLLGIIAVQTTNSGDLAVLDSDVCFIRRYQRSVDNRTAFYDGVEVSHFSSSLLPVNRPVKRPRGLAAGRVLYGQVGRLPPPMGVLARCLNWPLDSRVLVRQIVNRNCSIPHQAAVNID